VEAKNEAGKLGKAIKESCDYADEIIRHGKFILRIAIGAAGEEDGGFEVAVRFRTSQGEWIPLKARGAELTAIPSKSEIEAALAADDGTTNVSIPDQSEFIDAAIELSIVLRKAKIEAPLRPKVIGALVSAMHSGRVDISANKALASVNTLLKATLDDFKDVPPAKIKALYDALRLSGADFNRLSPHIGRITTILQRLNVRAVLKTDADFLGIFYEAFLRYGYDNNSLGIVFTPRHITRFCARLSDLEAQHQIVDIASGTGGFLVAAFDQMNSKSISQAQRDKIRENIYGFDTNPTIWALASLNMFFRGDGKSHIENSSSLEQNNRLSIEKSFDRAYLNPPFSQDDEPERDFIDASLSALKPGGILVAVVLAGVFADEEHAQWRSRFLKHHRLLGMISLPEDLFYPAAAPTSILIAQAHVPHGNSKAFMARIWNDGFEKLKGRRVPCEGEQLESVENLFYKYRSGQDIRSPLASVCDGSDIADGEEWSPQLWLTQPKANESEINAAQSTVVRAMFKAVSQFPKLADVALEDFGDDWANKQPLPTAERVKLTDIFNLANGRSKGEKNFPEGEIPYISSGDELNSIVRLVTPTEEGEVFKHGAVTVTAFGLASVQPWPFIARGNGGSSVRVLIPKKKMSVKELVWFAAQINLQRWRYFYGRQAILSRLKSGHFQLQNLSVELPDSSVNLASRLRQFRISLEEQSVL
jgi:SAM-dependent methyltransferase